MGPVRGGHVGPSLRQAHQHRRAVIEVTALHAALGALAGRRRRRWITTSWLTALSHLGMLGPATSIGSATIVSIVRANLPVVAPGTPWLGVIAVISDKADGVLARRAGPTQFGHYADSLADATFWACFARRYETDRRILAVAALAWIGPVVAVSFGRGRMIDAPRSAWLRPAAALQAVIALRAVRRRPRRRRHPIGDTLRG